MQNKRIRVGVLVNEYFGELGTGRGGYGFLAKNIVAKLFPRFANVEIEILLGKRGKKSKDYWWKFLSAVFPKKYIVEGVSVFFTPRIRFFSRRFLARYDVFLSVEDSGIDILKSSPKTPLVFWIQDPRPWYEWKDILTVNICPEGSYYDAKRYEFIHSKIKDGNVKFVSQARFLNEKAEDLYRFTSKEQIEFIPNPLELKFATREEIEKKRNAVVFLGRLDNVKRAWLFCELAKKCPEFDFYVCGSTTDRDSQKVMRPYFEEEIKNLHFLGHVVGGEKNEILKKAKILVNTSIHEALPVSFIEALAFGCLLVSCQNPDDLTNRFGIWTGKVLGDGFSDVEKFSDAVRRVMSDETKRVETAIKAVEYVKTVHDPATVFARLDAVLRSFLQL